MFTLFLIYLLVLLAVSWRIKGPLLGFAASWLLSCSPIFLNAVTYNYFDSSDLSYVFFLVVYLSLFAAGVLIAQQLHALRAGKIASFDYASPSVRNKISSIAGQVWIIALVAIGAQFFDFFVLGNIGTDDFSALRDVFQAKVSTPATLVANITSWACLYCFAFAILRKNELSTYEFFKYLTPTAGYFLVSVFSAGRQAAFQLFLFAIVLYFMAPKGYRFNIALKQKNLVIMGVAVMSLIYMGFIAIARNDNAISDDKTIVLQQLFDFELSDWFFALTGYLGTSISGSIVEALVYFSSSISLFSEFLRLNTVSDFHSFGAMTFPFMMRQIEPITGISVLGALDEKIRLMYGAGAMGSGWTTGISSYILDFGYIGAALCMLGIGYYSQVMWLRGKRTEELHDQIVAALMVVSSIYMPFLLASAETNLFLLWLFCLGANKYIRTRLRSTSH